MLFLGENLGMVLVLSKGRCANAPLLMLLRKAAALSLATGLIFHMRWLSSVANPADSPSRVLEPSAHRCVGRPGGTAPAQQADRPASLQAARHVVLPTAGRAHNRRSLGAAVAALHTGAAAPPHLAQPGPLAVGDQEARPPSGGRVTSGQHRVVREGSGDWHHSGRRAHR